MTITPARAEEVASIIRVNEITDEEVRHYVKSLTKRNKDRTPYYDKVHEELKEHGKISSKDMKDYPNAPPSGNRACRKEAIDKASAKLGKSVKRVGEWYIVQEDLTEHVDFFLKNMAMNTASFNANCLKRGVDPDAIKNAFNGQVRTLSDGTMELIV